MRAGDPFPPSVPLSFANCFWGRDEKGADVLFERMSDAKAVCEEVKAFYHERAAAEEEYAKKLIKISKMPLGTKECGTLKASLVSVKAELEAMGNAHAEVASSMRRELEDAVVTHSNTMRERRKLVQTNIEKLRRTKQAQEQQLHKLKEKYDADCIKINGYIAQQNMLMGKELDKNNAKLEKSQMSVQASNRDYKAAVKVLQETTNRWNQEWKHACDKFQDLEEERIDFLKSNLWTYANIMSTVCVSDDETCEKIRVNLEKCEVDEVIQAFVQTKGTGQEIPDAPRYQNFYRKEETDDDAGYKVAQFSRDSNPQFRSSTPQFTPSDDESTAMRPTTGMSTRYEEQPEQRPMTGMSIRHDEASQQRPMTGMSVRHEEQQRPMTGMAQRHDSEPTIRPSTGVSTRGGGGGAGGGVHERSQSRGRPLTMQNMLDESPPASQRSRSRGASQSPLKGVINEYPEEGITQFCRSDSSSARHGRPLANSSRHSSASSMYSASEAPTTSASDSSSFALSTPVRKAMAPPVSPKVLHRRTDTKGGGTNSATTSPSVSPSKKSHSFWNFGSKSPKQPTPKSTPSASPIKNSKSMPTGMAMSVPSLDIGGASSSPGNNRSRRGASEEPIAPGASVMLNIGDNVLEVGNPDQKKRQSVHEEPELSLDQTDPLMAALEDLKLASKTPRIPSPSKRSPTDNAFGRHSGSRNDMNSSSFGRSESRNEVDSPVYERSTPSRQDQGMRTSTSQNIRQSQTPPSRGNPARSASPQPPVYDTRRNTLGAPPPAHSAAEMERTRRQYAGQVQQVLNGRPGTGIPRSTSPRPMSRQSTYDDGSYNGRPGSSMGMGHPGDMLRSRSPAPMQQQSMPPRSRSPAPMQQGMPPRSRSPAPMMQQGMPPRSRSPAPMMQNIPPRSRSPAPPMSMHNIPPRSRSPAPPRPMSRQDLHYEAQRPTSRQDSYPRRSVSPAPYSQPPPRGGYQDDSMGMRGRSPSPNPYARSASPAPMMARPRSSANIAGPNNPFGISMDRFGNVMDGPSPQGGNRYSGGGAGSGGYAYGSAHRHDIDDVAGRDARYAAPPSQMRARSKSSGDLRRKLTEDGRPILFSAKALYDYTAAIPEECNFRKGDIVCVTRTQDDGWWVGEFMGTRPAIRGLVPRHVPPLPR